MYRSRGILGSRPPHPIRLTPRKKRRNYQNMIPSWKRFLHGVKDGQSGRTVRPISMLNHRLFTKIRPEKEHRK